MTDVTEVRRKRDVNIDAAERLLYGTVEGTPEYAAAMVAASAHATVALVQDRIIERLNEARGGWGR